MDAPPPIVVVMPVRDELRAVGRDLLPLGARITVQWLSPGRWIVKGTVRGRRVGTLVATVGADSLRVEPRMSLHDLEAERAAALRWRRAHPRG